MTRMKKKYLEEVAPALMEKFQYKSTMQIPRIDKIVVSVGCGDCKDNAKALDAVIKDIAPSPVSTPLIPLQESLLQTSSCVKA